MNSQSVSQIDTREPKDILEQIKISSEIKAADFGCGSGHFTIPLAHILKHGKVFAIDVLKEALEALQSRAKLTGINNIEIIRANLERVGSSGLADDSLDLVLARNILFQSKYKREIIEEAKRILRRGGRLIIIDWLPKSMMAPNGTYLISKEELQNIIEGIGLILERELDAGNQHYGLVFVKS